MTDARVSGNILFPIHGDSLAEIRAKTTSIRGLHLDAAVEKACPCEAEMRLSMRSVDENGDESGLRVGISPDIPQQYPVHREAPV